MVFSSNIFMFVFLPLFLAAYYLTPNRGRLRNGVILVGSYLFYAWWRADFLLLFALMTVVNYLLGARIAARGPRSLAAKRWLQLGVVLNLAVLGYFKYTNFGVRTLNDLIEHYGGTPFAITHVLLPIGISFYTFESISYLADVYRGDVEATKHPVDFATFVSLFPHLIVGPIFRYKDLAGQFEHREHTAGKFGMGAARFMKGFVKKVFIADSLSPLANACFALPDPSSADAWLGAAAYGAQLYFDFAAYSDMAIGLGLMMGFTFLENFNRPFLSQSNTEFWRRWHISLSNWLRDYVYYSLGGNRHGTVRTYVNVFLTFFLGGIWHGANWTYVCWGALQGSLIFIERTQGISGYAREFRWRRWLPTFVCIMASMIIFRADSVGVAWRMFRPFFLTRHVGWISEPLAGSLTGLELVALALAYGWVLVEGLREFGPKLSPGAEPLRGALAVFVLLPLFVVALTKLLSQGYTPFLYFQF